jgi:predicted O-methyltransferase YrrM
MKIDTPYTVFQKSIRYFDYLKKSVNRHDVHSPFVYGLIEDVFRNPLNKSKGNAIEVERKFLLKNNTPVFIEDFGAKKSRQSTVKEIASRSLKDPKYASIIGKLVEHYQPKSVLELGTSLGISTAYLSQGNTSVYTIEGSDAILDQAKKVWHNLNLSNIQSSNGSFDKNLEKVWPEIKQPVIVFVDGNHTYRATLRYFDFFINRLKNDSFIVFDDIHWSPGMEHAWEKIIADKRVSLSVDIFEMGLIFLRKGVEKQHFIIRF